MTPARFRTASLSRVGGHERNEDACGYCLDAAGGVWVVADGLSGHVGGKRAAQLAVATLIEILSDVPPRSSADLAQAMDESQQALASAGDIPAGAIRSHEDRNRLLRCLGGEGTARPSVIEEPVPLEAGDVFLLCSDGFWEPVTEEDMTTTLTTASGPEVWLAEKE